MNLDIQAAAVLIVASFDLILGGIILAQDLRNRTNIAFTLLSTSAAFWGFGVGLFLIVSPTQIFWFDFFARLIYFAGGFIPTAFLYFGLVFGSDTPPSSKARFIVFAPSALFIFLYFFTPLLIVGPIIADDGIRGYVYGPWYHLFDVHIWAYFILAFILFVKKYKSLSHSARKHVLFIMFGTYSSLAVAGVTNIIFLSLYIFEYMWVGPVSTISWLCAVGYSVARHQLFNVRVIAAELLIVLLWIMFLLRVIISRGENDFIINAGFFLAVLVLGVFLMRSVIKKIEQREKIEAQDNELALMNNKQESLLNFISHEVKGYFAKSEAVFAGINEGDYGIAPEPLKEMAANGLKDIRTGTSMVINILDASNMKKGAVSYKQSLFDIKKTVHEVAEDLRTDAEAKGLELTVSDNVSGVCVVHGDEAKIRKHIIGNLIDNAIRYTMSGAVKVELTCTGPVARIAVEDTGIGITPEDKGRLFTEGGHGKDSTKVNVHSTGYGLFVAKQVAEAHHGTIRAVSEGAGKGARFTVELPVVVG